MAAAQPGTAHATARPTRRPPTPPGSQAGSHRHPTQRDPEPTEAFDITAITSHPATAADTSQLAGSRSHRGSELATASHSHADVSEFRLCILMQPSAFSFVISNVVRYTWLGTGTHPSGWARSPNRAPRCGDCSPSFCALLPGVQGQAAPGFGDNSRTRYGRVARTAGPPGSGVLSVGISSPGSPRPAVRCGVPGRSVGRC
jgi:hypothetical protein